MPVRSSQATHWTGSLGRHVITCSREPYELADSPSEQRPFPGIFWKRSRLSRYRGFESFPLPDARLLTIYRAASAARQGLYVPLSNSLYIGEIRCRGVRHPGQYQPIVDRALWERTQQRLREHTVRRGALERLSAGAPGVGRAAKLRVRIYLMPARIPALLPRSVVEQSELRVVSLDDS